MYFVDLKLKSKYRNSSFTLPIILFKSMGRQPITLNTVMNSLTLVEQLQTQCLTYPSLT